MGPNKMLVKNTFTFYLFGCRHLEDTLQAIKKRDSLNSANIMKIPRQNTQQIINYPTTIQQQLNFLLAFRIPHALRMSH